MEYPALFKYPVEERFFCRKDDGRPKRTVHSPFSEGSRYRIAAVPSWPLPRRRVCWQDRKISTRPSSCQAALRSRRLMPGSFNTVGATGPRRQRVPTPGCLRDGRPSVGVSVLFRNTAPVSAPTAPPVAAPTALAFPFCSHSTAHLSVSEAIVASALGTPDRKACCFLRMAVVVEQDLWSIR